MFVFCIGRARCAALPLPGDAVPGGHGVLALHAEASLPPSGDPLRARVVLAEQVQAGLPGHVESHGLLVVHVDVFPGRHVPLEERRPCCYTRLLLHWLPLVERNKLKPHPHLFSLDLSLRRRVTPL